MKFNALNSQYQMAKKQALKFNYAVGHHWTDSSGSVGVYNYFGEVHYGTLEEANHMLKYVQDKDKKSPKTDRRDWKIFMLVEVPT
jgi:hypothetical protein